MAANFRKLYIKLIAPKMSLRPMDSEFKRRMSPSLSLVTIAGLTPREHHVTIVDENISAINFNDIPDIIGITVTVDTALRAIKIASQFRKKGCKVIFGGIHASANPDQLINFCDAVCIGEAEELWETIINDVIHNKLKSRYFKLKPTNLANFPIPEWKYINKNKYLYSNVIITSRGCPFKCDFCYNSCDYIIHKFRNRPVDHVLKEIDSLNTNQIYFIDDNFIGNKKYTMKLLAGIKERNIIWHGTVSANLSGQDTLIEQMANSGCKSLFIGFESINQNGLAQVNKSQNNIIMYEHLIKSLHDRAIMVNASLVFGLDTDTKDVFPQTLNWLIKNKIETMTAHILTPYPGTVLYNKLMKANRIFDYNLNNYNTSNVVFKPTNMSAEELKKGYLWMYQHFYSHRNIFKRIPTRKENHIPYFLFNYIYRKYGKFFSLISKNSIMRKAGLLASKLSYGIGS